MKYVLQFFTLFLLFNILSACQKSEEPIKIGFMLHALDKERWENDRDFFVQHAEHLGATVVVVEAGNDADEQYKQAQKLLAEGIDVLVVVPVDQFSAAKIADAAKKVNVPVVSYDRLIMNCSLDFYISTDNVEIGELQAKYLTTIKPEGKYALIGGAMADHNSQFLQLGHMNVLAPLIEKGDLKVVLNTYTQEWGEQEGYEIMQKFLSSPNSIPDAVIAGNDAIAFGAMRALENANLLGRVLVAGMDSDLRNLQEIVKGNQTCTIYKPLQKMATTAADIAFRLGSGLECERTFQTTSNGHMLVPSMLFSGVVVNKQNLRLTVVSEGYQSEADIFD